MTNCRTMSLSAAAIAAMDEKIRAFLGGLLEEILEDAELPRDLASGSARLWLQPVHEESQELELAVGDQTEPELIGLYGGIVEEAIRDELGKIYRECATL